MKKLVLLSTALLLLAGFVQADPRFTTTGNPPANVFTDPSAVSFTLADGGTTQAYQWQATDWQGTTVASGDCAATDSGKITLPALPLGFYRLIATVSGTQVAKTSFALVIDPGTRSTSPDCPYNLDSAQTSVLSVTRKFNPYQPGNDYEVLSNLVKLAGVPMSRERLSWPATNPSPGVFQFKGYDDTINNLATRGVKLCDMFTFAPKWSNGDLQSLPRDLQSLYNFAKAVSSHYQSQVPAWEFWNEPDDMYCLDSAWDFASAQKAAFAGFRSGNPAAKVLIGANATSPTPRFVEVVLQNDAANFFDAYNFHTYVSAGALNQVISEKQALLKKYGISTKPLWLTEIGLQNEGPGGLAADVPGQNLREHDPNQEMEQARFMVYAMITGQARGLSRLFFFVLPPYNEQDGGKVWGLLTWDWTVKPAYVALANLTSQLGAASYLGPINLGSGVAGWLFERKNDQVIVSWSDTEQDIDLPAVPTSAVDIMGKSTAVKSTTVHISQNPQYFTGFHRLKPTPMLGNPSISKPDSPTIDHNLVLSIRFGTDVKILNRISADFSSQPTHNADLLVSNFSSTTRTYTPANSSQSITVGSLPDSVSVPGGKTVVVPITAGLSSPDATTCYLRLAGSDEAGDVSPLFVPVNSPGDPFSDAKAVALPANEPAAWVSSASGAMVAKADSDESAVQFLVHYPAGASRWIYPKFDLAGRKISLAKTIGLSFEVRLLTPPDPSKVNKAYLMVNTMKNGKAGNFQFSFKPNAPWKKVSFVWDRDAPNGFDPSIANAIKIGMNPLVDDFAYEVRNVTIYYDATGN
ncbi:MAG: hypothetical protein QM796_15135 [Chthoniobacteraceae bacterium]